MTALIGQEFPQIALEIFYVASAEPNPRTFEVMIAQMERITTKPVVAANLTRIEDPEVDARTTWRVGDAVALAQRYSVHGLQLGEIAEGSTAHVIVFYLSGDYIEDESDLRQGVTTAGRAFVFRNTTLNPQTGTGGLARAGMPEETEIRISLHEFGHLLGLVNCGIPMVTAREDAASPCHSTEDDSVMGRGALMAVDAAGQPRVGYAMDFNDHDREDVEAFRASLAR